MAFFDRIRAQKSDGEPVQKSWDAWNAAHQSGGKAGGSDKGHASETRDPYEGLSYRSSGHDQARAGVRAAVGGHSQAQVKEAARDAGLDKDGMNNMLQAHKNAKAYKPAKEYDSDMESALADARTHMGK